MSEHVHGPDCGHGTPVRLGEVGGKEPCPCGSGKKYKHCCYQRDAASTPATPAMHARAATDDASEAPPAESPHGGPKAPPLPRGPVRPPSKPPQGAVKALGRRSGHR
ncbi:MAG: SEC-C domain-containing protein [Candidatus Sericytochromatia bacterium]|nr:SEC-C domain-containing protein [Candidatus Tanganyikabacteria bacterium]